MKFLSLESRSEQRVGYQQRVKEQNIKRVFDLVRAGKCASRAELVRTMHLSATTVSALVDELNAKGLILEAGPSLTPLPGRRPMKLRLNHAGHQLAIFSLSRRGVRFHLYDLGCRVLETFFVEHPAGATGKKDFGRDYARLFEDVLLKRSQKFDSSSALVIGVSFPGIYLEEEKAFYVETAMDVSISELSMRELEQRLGIPIFFANVSMCYAYAEKKYLDASLEPEAETRDLIFINICDGVGAGIVSNGNILTGPYNTAGEFGHISIDFHGSPCNCGNRGCLENYVNQNAILESVARACSEAHETLPKSFADLKGIYDRNPAARMVLDEVAEKLGIGIYTMICATGIRRIVVGGGIEILGEGFLEHLRNCASKRHHLTRHMHMSYAHAGADGDSLGLAHYFLDKAYSITMHE
ncbi:MAG: ROK family transcriptional regulator [Clostridia bacterium]|nr:ROK family transcriptional regulator [Clostridia bacterium]